MSIPGSASPLFFQTAAAAGAAAAGPTKSLRFNGNGNDDPYLERSVSSASNRRTFTFAAWVKNDFKPGNDGRIFSAGTSPSNIFDITLSSSNEGSHLRIYNKTTTVHTNWNTANKLRDVAAWFHVVVGIDTTSATQADRVKVYINGVHITDNGTTNTLPSQNDQMAVNDAVNHYIGRSGYYGGDRMAGYLADIYFIDGSQLDPTSFGAFDSNGVWQSAAYSGTYGTNGFHLLDFENESTIGHDSSGNENDFTAVNLAATGIVSPSVTSTGDPTSSTDNPFSSGYSVDFDGDDSLRITGPGTITGDFTVECFVKSSSYSGTKRIFSADQASQSDERLNLRCYNGNTEFYVAPGVSASGTNLPTNQWNHIAITRSGSDVSYYLNGSRWATDTHSAAISVTTFVVAHGFASEYFTGKVSNARFVDGQALYTGTSYTVPTATLTTTSQGATAANVRLICCHQSSVTAAEGAIPDPAGTDVLFDAPTNGTQSDTGAGGEVSGNYCTWNSIAEYDPSPTFSNGNLEFTASGDWNIARGTIAVKTGKYYAEFTTKGATMLGIETDVADAGRPYYNNSVGCIALRSNGKVFIDNVEQTQLGGWSDGNVIGMALDLDGGSFVVTKDGSAYTTISIPSNSYWDDKDVFYSATALAGGNTVTANWGQRAFSNSAPSNHKALCTTNLPTPTIAKSSDYFDIKTYTGNGGNQTISGYDFGPDFVWLKNRAGGTSSTIWHVLADTVRGNNAIFANSNNVEVSGYLNGFTTDGFKVQVSPNDTANKNNDSYVAWAWEGGSSTVSNTDGSISAQVRANQTAGFSIVTYTGNGSTSGTVGHGLNASPGLVIVKARNASLDIKVNHSSLDTQYMVSLDQNYQDGIASWNGVTNSVFKPARSGDTYLNGNGTNYLAYCFAPVEGFSKFSSFSGNGAVDGPFVYTGFRPALIIYKNKTDTENWLMLDSTRDPENPVNTHLHPNLPNGDYDASPPWADFLSNGFKLRNLYNETNGNGDTILYMAWAENPFQANGGLAR